MRVHLLYEDSEWVGKDRYYDYKSIISDLGLDALFRTASREQVKQEGQVRSVIAEDPWVADVMSRVMMVPLEREEDMSYRQEIMKDFLEQESFLRELYDFSQETLQKWDKLGRKQNEKVNNRDAATNLVTKVRVLRLFVERLEVLKELVGTYRENVKSQGLKAFIQHLDEDFSEEMQENLNRILEDISFYVDRDLNPYEWEDRHRLSKKARIVMQCDISEGLKFNDLRLEEVETLGKKYKKRKRPKTFMQRYLGAFAPSASVLLKEDILLAETKQLEYQIVYYLTGCCESFTNACKDFFDQLSVQTAFYRGALNLYYRLERHSICYCFPKAGGQNQLSFRELKDFGMAIEQHINPVGNQADIQDKNLLIVTGANQGGKSTFLRSIGIAQVMMQCGLFVSAEEFCSGIYPAFFTHFTRREDSEMNSGRLDEELGRMSRIIDHLGDRSLVLLNESFATTTEKEGSVIAYDIIKAMTQAGVKVLTVTHLLSFAKKVYEEADSSVEFLSAERKEDGRRTFKMIQHAPELTSFGLDLYEQIIEGEREQ